MKGRHLAHGLLMWCLVLVATNQPLAQSSRRSPTVLTRLSDIIWSITFSPDGRTLAIARGVIGTGRVELWDVESGALRHSIKGFDGSVSSVSFTPDGRTLVSGSLGYRLNRLPEKGVRLDGTPFLELKWWDSATGDLKQRVELPGDRRVSYIAIHSPDGKSLASVEYRIVGMKFHPPEIEAGLSRDSVPRLVTYHSDMSRIYEADLKLLDARTGELKTKLKGGMGSYELRLLSGGDPPTELFSRYGMYPGRQPLAFSPDGRLVAAWTRNEVKLWDAATGEEVRRLKDFQGYLSGAAFSPDSRTLAVVITSSSLKENRPEFRSEIRTWDVATGLPKQVLPLSTQSSSGLMFALNGQQLMVSGIVREDGRTFATLELADLQRGTLGRVATGEEGASSSAVLSPDGRMVAFQTDASSLCLVDTVSWKIKHTFDETSDSSTTNTASGRYFVSVKSVMTLAFSADGKTVAGEIEHGGIKLWDPRTGEVKKYFGDQDKTGSMAAISSKGNILAEAGSDEETLRVWNLATGEKKVIPTAGGSVSAMALSTDGRRLAVAQPHSILMIDTATSGLLKKLDIPTAKINCLSLSPDGLTLAVAGEGGQIQTWDLAGGQTLRTITGAGQVTALRFAPAGRTLASAAVDGSVSLWDLQTGALTWQLKKHPGAVNAIAFSADGNTLATGGDDRSVIVWEVATGKALRTLKGHDLSVTSLAFSSDGSLLASGAGNASVVLWDMPAGKLNRVMK